ncbi:MAG: tetratricopeptide repeat protein [Phycisphaerales bacterium]|nr:tetratricopeptide repeat protein [Phycisphaerales bacterium]
MRSINRRGVRILLVLGLLAPVAAAPGCKGAGPARPSGPAFESEAVRVADAQRLALEAERHAAAGRVADAVTTYESALGRYAEFGPAWHNLGELYMRQERYLEAAEAFSRAAELSPSDPRPLYNLGVLYFNRKYPREARTEWVRALDRDPNYLPALRGVIEVDWLLRDKNDLTLPRIERALMLERDPGVRKELEFRKLRIETQDEAEAKSAPGPKPRS